MEHDAKVLEKEGYELLNEEKHAEAFKKFHKAAEGYLAEHNYKQAALMFASAASCWAIKSGEKTFQNAAASYEKAAMAAQKAGDWEYASLLYKYAATNYERDMEFSSFSECYYRSKECLRKFYALSLATPRKIHHVLRHKEEKGIISVLKRFLLWLALTFSYLVWGHGERPARSFVSAAGLIILAAVSYTFGNLARGAEIFRPNFLQALYLSVVTFSTVGYGDITPVGFTRVIAMVEALSGLCVIPIFITGLSRKYLRI